MQRKHPVTSITPLPNDFAESILKLEINVDVDPSLESLRSLLELYSVIYKQQAIEFYEAIRDPKYKYYQDRMMELLQKQNTLLLASHDEPPPRHSISVSKELLQQRQADKAIKLHNEASQNVSRQISMNLQSQNSTMLSRFNNRKSRNISAEPKNPSNFGKIFFPSGGHHKRRSSEGESDKSGGKPSISNDAEQFEKELEEIMEQSVMEKIEKTQEIKKKYREEIEEIQKMKGNALMDQLIKELQKGMQEELSTLETNLEYKRKIAIKKIRDFLVAR